MGDPWRKGKMAEQVQKQGKGQLVSQYLFIQDNLWVCLGVRRGAQSL